jgi:serpin B
MPNARRPEFPLPIVAAALVVGACTPGSLNQASISVPKPTPGEKLEAAKFSDSALAFTRRYCAEVLPEADANSLVSPLSAQLAFGMLAEGTAGTTQKELLGALSSTSSATLTKEASAATRVLQEDGSLSIANGLFWRTPPEIATKYIGRLTSGYLTETAPLPDDNSAAVALVNGWVKKKTRNMIPVLFESLRADDRLVLVNAIAFEGKWQKEFEASQTRPTPFTNQKGQKDVPMMFAEMELAYKSTPKFDVVHLGYVGQVYAMALLRFPKEASPTAEIRNFDPKDWEAAMSTGDFAEVNLGLPRFKFSNSYDLQRPMQRLGAKKIFTRGDFTPMDPTDNLTHVSQAIQKTFIEVDESGTKAAAATGIAVAAESAALEPRKKIEFILDRPFGFIIFHRESGLPVFIGTVDDPTAD